MTAPPLFVRSHHGAFKEPFAQMAANGLIDPIAEWDVTPARITAAGGVILTMHLDQIRAEGWAGAFDALLAGGGRIFLNGHMARPFLSGLAPFVLSGRSRADLHQTVLAPHPVFDGIDRELFQRRRGVAGFYGRGHNPPPPGAVALTGIGRTQAPLDWVWHAPTGGAIFSHAGNDLWTNTEEDGANERLALNVLDWVTGKTGKGP